MTTLGLCSLSPSAERVKVKLQKPSVARFLSASTLSSAARRKAQKRSVAAGENDRVGDHHYPSESESSRELEASDHGARQKPGEVPQSTRARAFWQTVALVKGSGWNNRWRAWGFRWHGQPSLVVEPKFGLKAARSGALVRWLRAQPIRSALQGLSEAQGPAGQFSTAALAAKPPRTTLLVALAQTVRTRNEVSACTAPRAKTFRVGTTRRVSGRRDTIVRIAAAPARS